MNYRCLDYTLLNYWLNKCCLWRIGYGLEIWWTIKWNVGWDSWSGYELWASSNSTACINSSWDRLICTTVNNSCVWSIWTLLDGICSSIKGISLLFFHFIIRIPIISTESISVVISRCYISCICNTDIISSIKLCSIALALLDITAGDYILSNGLGCCISSGYNLLII